MRDPLLELIGIEKAYKTHGKNHVVKAVDGITFTIHRGESLGLVGESGCGKSTLARIALRLIAPTAGSVRLEGRDITQESDRKMRPIRRRMQAVFQDPLATLNQRMSIADALKEVFTTHDLHPAEGRETAIQKVMQQVGLASADLSKLPRQFSGGQLQRIGIAKALLLEPELIVADEPTSALDPSIQAQIANLLLDIRRRRAISYFIISHDLDLIGHLSDTIAVMYLGRIIEIGPARDIMALPLHPYTQALLSAAPPLSRRKSGNSGRIILKGEAPNPAQVPSGCRFHPRCPMAIDICKQVVPEARTIAGSSRQVACHLAPMETEALGRVIGRSPLAV